MSTHINSIEAQSDRAPTQWENALSSLAVISLAGITFAALANGARPTTADKLTFFILAIAGLFFTFTALRHRIEDNREAVTFWITAAMFVIYGLSRRSIEGGVSVTLALLPDTPQTVSYVSIATCLLAILTAPLWWKRRASWTGAVISALAVVAVISISIFMFLAKFYTVGEVEILDPLPLVETLKQTIEFGALALICCAATSLPTSRRLMLRLLPLLLLMLWARHIFAPAPMEEAE